MGIEGERDGEGEFEQPDTNKVEHPERENRYGQESRQSKRARTRQESATDRANVFRTSSTRPCHSRSRRSRVGQTIVWDLACVVGCGVRVVTLTWPQSGQVSEPSAVDPQQSAGGSNPEAGASALLSPPSAKPPAIPAPPPQSGGREAEREEVIDSVCCMKLLSTSQPFSCMASHSESGAWSRARVVRACSADVEAS